MCFYLEYFVQVNKSKVIISVSFSHFQSHQNVCSLPLFQEQRQTSLKEEEEEEGLTTNQKARKAERERVRECVRSVYNPPLCSRSHMFLFVLLSSSGIFEQGYAFVTALLSLRACALKKASSFTPVTFGYNVTASIASHPSRSLLPAIHCRGCAPVPFLTISLTPLVSNNLFVQHFGDLSQ